ncbi:hypothetical protein E2C01_062559 [Portunus trituberculatus]|uniref:Uncharacterized protein n=1 Tax=Portunus trituberculatus TaxID=210409 RepID=A0A5B7HF09_PORTR|nr:hypothetical protein [Portunus trituberculatus]
MYWCANNVTDVRDTLGTQVVSGFTYLPAHLLSLMLLCLSPAHSPSHSFLETKTRYAFITPLPENNIKASLG